MRHPISSLSFVFLSAMSLAGLAMAEEEKSFANKCGDVKTGAIRVPEDYTLWPVLGT